MTSSDTDTHSIETGCLSCEITTILSIAGIVIVLLKLYFKGSKNNSHRDLTGQVVIITGSNTGIGLDTAKEVARAGAKVILACRDQSRGKQAETVVNEVRSGSAEFLRLDLSDLSSVRLFVNEFKSKYNQLDILINNAGIMHTPERKLTKDGFESQIGTNHFGHFLLTNLLLDLLKKKQQFRVINVSSLAHSHGGINLDDLNFEKRSYNRIEAYSQSKLANILFTQALQRRLDKEKIEGKTVSLHPGVVRTELMRQYTGILALIVKIVQPIFYIFSKSSLEGAQTTLHCVFEDYSKLQKGEYFSDCKVKATNNKQITVESGERLWEISKNLVKL